MYKKVINKRSNINFQAKHPPSLMEPYLKSIIDEDKSNTEDINDISTNNLTYDEVEDIINKVLNN